MTRTLGRRDFLVGTAMLAGLAVGDGFKCVEFAEEMLYGHLRKGAVK